ncbi:hypothetical protein LPB140_02845 [Sphingorhabdus lutea]|uniref:Uncharacterized protein n=1 Tax=Sphingorhabdus lutea TaxID=1913578 RepID=A0A1L3JA00_9SPHN|nr:hypothetical protein LPB140_02845 [Sphingorhabdus lutea]
MQIICFFYKIIPKITIFHSFGRNIESYDRDFLAQLYPRGLCLYIGSSGVNKLMVNLISCKQSPNYFKG